MTRSLLTFVLVLLALLSVRCDCGGAVVDVDAGAVADAATDAAIADAAASDGRRDGGAAIDAAGTEHSAADRGPGDGTATDVARIDVATFDAAAIDVPAIDVAATDASAADHGAADAAAADQAPLRDAAPLDARACVGTTCTPGVARCHVCVDIYIDNFCNTSTVPSSIDVPAGTTLTISFHNRSVDYTADVWSSSIYGYLGLELGATWNDPIDHCAGDSVYSEYFDISINGGGSSSCPGVRLNIHCQ